MLVDLLADCDGFLTGAEEYADASKLATFQIQLLFGESYRCRLSHRIENRRVITGGYGPGKGPQ